MGPGFLCLDPSFPWLSLPCPLLPLAFFALSPPSPGFLCLVPSHFNNSNNSNDSGNSNISNNSSNSNNPRNLNNSSISNNSSNPNNSNNSENSNNSNNSSNSSNSSALVFPLRPEHLACKTFCHQVLFRKEGIEILQLTKIKKLCAHS